MAKTQAADDWKQPALRRTTLKARTDPAFASALRLDARTLLEVSPDFAELSSSELFDFMMCLRAEGVLTPNLFAPNLLHC